MKAKSNAKQGSFCQGMIKWSKEFLPCLWFDPQGYKEQKGH